MQPRIMGLLPLAALPPRATNRLRAAYRAVKKKVLPLVQSRN
jgi:hypothetical protein